MRRSKSTSSKILAKMPNGSEVTVKSKSGNWYECIYNGIEGYAYASYIRIIS